VLARVDDLLEEWGGYIILVSDSPSDRDAKMEKKKNKYANSASGDEDSIPSEKAIVANILRFLKTLLQSGKDKRCFLSYISVGKLLRAVDLTIVELASWVLFNAATPTFSVATVECI
jgi:hypothetical protein